MGSSECDFCTTPPTLAAGEVVVVVEHPHALERVERRVVLLVHLGLRVRPCSFFKEVLARERDTQTGTRHGHQRVTAALQREKSAIVRSVRVCESNAWMI